MKYILVFILLFLVNLSAQNVTISDYQVPVSKAQTLRFDGRWNWAQRGDSVTANNANASVFYRTFYSSLPLAWNIDIDATGGKTFANYTHNVVLNASFQKYIWNNRDVFGFNSLFAQHAKTYKQIASDLTVGFGYGRYINATPLAKAVRIEDHLLRDGVITAYLPKDVMIRIANIIEREDEYRVLYGDTYETEWFDDIEDEIQETEVLEGENLGSIGILRMQQVLKGINERVNQRYYGWDARLGILFPLSTADKSPAGKPNLSLSGRYSIPINWQFQLNARLEVFSPLDSSFVKEINARLVVDFIYEFSNRVNFLTSYRFGLFKPNSEAAIFDHALTASFWYYLENNIYLTINTDFIKQANFPNVLSTSVGLQYNLF